MPDKSGSNRQQKAASRAYRKQPQIAVVAVARELVGFLWAVMQDVPADLAIIQPAA